MPKEGNLQVWWIPQIPMKAFEVPVSSVTEGAKILNVLADYDLFQLNNNIKPDFSNTGGLNIFEGGEWVTWYHPDTGGDINEWESENGL